MNLLDLSTETAQRVPEAFWYVTTIVLATTLISIIWRYFAKLEAMLKAFQQEFKEIAITNAGRDQKLTDHATRIEKNSKDIEDIRTHLPKKR